MDKVKLNIVFCGEKNIGKTMFINNFLGNKNAINKNTIGVDIKTFFTKYKNFEVENNLWDLSGDPIYRDIIKTYFKITDIVILFVNSNKFYSIESIDNWIELVNKPLYIVNLGINIYSKNGFKIYNLLDKEPKDIFMDIFEHYYQNHPSKFNKIDIKNHDVYYKFDEEPKSFCNCKIL